MITDQPYVCHTFCITVFMSALCCVLHLAIFLSCVLLCVNICPLLCFNISHILVVCPVLSLNCVCPRKSCKCHCVLPPLVQTYFISQHQVKKRHVVRALLCGEISGMCWELCCMPHTVLLLIASDTLIAGVTTFSGSFTLCLSDTGLIGTLPSYMAKSFDFYILNIAYVDHHTFNSWKVSYIISDFHWKRILKCYVWL